MLIFGCFYKIKWQDIFAENIAKTLLRYTFNIHIQTPHFTAFKNLYNLQFIPIWNKNTTGNNASSHHCHMKTACHKVYSISNHPHKWELKYYPPTQCTCSSKHTNYITGQKKSLSIFYNNTDNLIKNMHFIFNSRANIHSNLVFSSIVFYPGCSGDGGYIPSFS